MPVFPAIFERLAGNLLSLDGSATQLQAIFLDVDAPLICLVVLSAYIMEIHINNMCKESFSKNMKDLGVTNAVEGLLVISSCIPKKVV